MKDENGKTLHAKPPVIPATIYQQLMLVVEDDPKLKLVAAHIDETMSLVLGYCEDGSVESWEPKCPIFSPDLVGIFEVVFSKRGIEADELALFLVARAPTEGVPLAPIIGRINPKDLN